MIVIRLLRVGRKNQPSYKIVVTDKRNPPRGGRFIEQIGFYNPLTKQRVLKKDRVQHWLSKGAQPSDTLHNLLVKEGILRASKRPVHKKTKGKKEEKGPEVATTTKEETPVSSPAKTEGKPKVEESPKTEAGKSEAESAPPEKPA